MDKRLLLAFLILFVSVTFGFAQTNVSGNITANTTWTKAKSPYILAGNVGIPTGYTLTIEPGVTVRRNADYQILINGAITANGIKTDSIAFESGTLSSIYNNYFIEFQKSNLNASSLSYISFGHTKQSAGVIQVGPTADNSSTTTTRNTGTLLISNCNLSYGAVTARDTRATAVVNIDNCVGYGTSVTNFSNTGAAESIHLSNCSFQTFALQVSSGSEMSLNNVKIDRSELSLNKYTTAFKVSNCRFTDTWIWDNLTQFDGTFTMNNTMCLNSVIYLQAGACNIQNSKFIVNQRLRNWWTGQQVDYTIQVGNLVLSNSEISNLSTESYNGIRLTGYKGNSISGSNSITYNLLNGMNTAFKIDNFSALQFKNNAFKNQDTYAIWNNTGSDVAASASYFLPRAGKSITDVIFDANDNLKYGTINYNPALTSPPENVPVSVPTNVFKSLENGSVKINWENTEPNIKGFRVYWGYVNDFTYAHQVDLGANASSYQISGITTAEEIAVTAITNNAIGTNDQVNGYESWFAKAAHRRPVITAFTPNTGASGTQVSITGNYLTEVSAVNFGGMPVASFAAVSPTSISAVIGNGGTGDVWVNSPGGAASMASFTYTGPPAITFFAPHEAKQGHLITITGTNLLGTSSVSIGGTAAESFKILSANAVIAVVAAGTKSGSVLITNSNGSSTADGFTYVDAPIISYTPQTFIAGTLINPPVLPQNSGGAVQSNIYGFSKRIGGSGLAGADDGFYASASFNQPFGAASDNRGNIYITDQAGNKIRKVTVTGTVSTLAGSGKSGYIDGTGTTASFYNPCGIAVAQDGNIYVADRYNFRIRKITASGVVTTLAGSGAIAYTDGIGTAASFKNPYGVAIGPDGNIYVTDDPFIRKITPSGVVTTIAGNATLAYPKSVNGVGTAAAFVGPAGIVSDAAGNLYVAETGSNLIRKITTDLVVTTLAGSGTVGSTNGTATQASFNKPTGITIDAAGNLYVSEQGNHIIRKITPQGKVTTLAGKVGVAGNTDSTGDLANFNQPAGMAFYNGNVYIADYGNHIIRALSTTGYTIEPALPAGIFFNRTSGLIGGTPATATPGAEYTVTAFNTSGSDTTKLSIAVTAPPPVITSISPVQATKNSKIGINGTFLTGTTAVTIGGAPSSSFTVVSPNLIIAVVPAAAQSGAVSITNPIGTATLNGFENAYAPAIAYNTPQTFIAGTAIGQVGLKNTGGAVPTAIYATTATFAGNGQASTVDGTGTSAGFYNPTGVAADEQGNLYITDQSSQKIRKVTPGGVVTTLAGSTKGFSDDTGTSAWFSNPSGITVGADGNIYVADRGNNRIRKITREGVVTTLAGSNSASALDGTGQFAGFNQPYGITTGTDGNLYVTDQSNNVIRKVTLQGVVTTVAGDGKATSVNGTGTSASFNQPAGIVADADGNIYVTESAGNVIRKITPSGVVTTLAGSGRSLYADGTGTQASFAQPTGLAIDAVGTLYVADRSTSTIRTVSRDGVVKSIAGSWTGNSGLANGVGTAALFNQPTGVACSRGKLYVTDFANNLVRSVDITGYTITPALPTGLSFDNQTGIISGIPATQFAATNFTVSAANAVGVDTAVIGIAVSLPQAPNISYSTPVSLALNNVITPLNPKNTGGPVNDADTNTLIFTGASSGNGFADGSATTARFSHATGITTDNKGNFYVADALNNRVRKVTADGTVSTLAGSGTSGSTNGTGMAASFANPTGVAIDALGNVYVADKNNRKIRKISPDGVVSTYAGTGSMSSVDGTLSTASFRDPRCIAIDGSGNLYISDSNGGGIRKITTNGLVTTIASGLNAPLGLATDGAGNVFVAESGNNQIRKITPTGIVSVFIGNTAINPLARFTTPQDIAIDPQDNLYVIDNSNFVARKVSPDGTITALPGFNPAATPATSFFPNGVTYANGILYLTENGRIRSVSLNGYRVAPALPDGLKLDVVTGIISGTPTTQSLTQEYIVTATTPGGSSSTKLTIGVTDAKTTNITFTNLPDATYGDADLALNANSNSTEAPIKYASSNPTVAAIVNEKLRILGVGTTIITASQAAGVNYAAPADVKQTLTVAPKAISVAATAKVKLYGDVDPALTYDITSGSLVNGDIFTGTLSRDAGENADVRYAITKGTLALNNNYALTINGATFSIMKRPVTVDATNKNKVYGDADPALTYTISSGSLVGNDSFTGSLTRPAGDNAGQYEIQKGTLAINDNYAFNFNKGTFTINKKALTVTAEDKVRMQGKNNPEFTLIYDGFVNGDDAKKLSTQPLITTTASTASPAGIYDLVPGGGVADNYAFVYKIGKLTVNTAANNFKVAAINVSCKGQNNGSINILPNLSANYTAVLTGSNINRTSAFTNGTTFDNLAPGSYNICIIDTALPNSPQCFDIVISEPKDLSVYASTDKASGMLTLALAGGSNYKVTLNGTVYKTSAKSITVPLQSGNNKLTVTTDQPCQGAFEEFYVQTDKQLPYPNPFQEVIYVNLGEEVVNKSTIKLYDVSSGALKLNQQFSAQSGVVRLDAAQLGMGVYSLHLIMDGKEKVYKLIKK